MQVSNMYTYLINNKFIGIYNIILTYAGKNCKNMLMCPQQPHLHAAQCKYIDMPMSYTVFPSFQQNRITRITMQIQRHPQRLTKPNVLICLEHVVQEIIMRSYMPCPRIQKVNGVIMSFPLQEYTHTNPVKWLQQRMSQRKTSNSKQD